MERTVGLGFAFDKLMDKYEEEIADGESIVSGLNKCCHISRIVGIIQNDMTAGEGSIIVSFYRDENGSQLVAEFEEDLDPGQHEIDVVPMADYVAFEITNDDSEAHTVSAAIAGHYGSCHRV